MSASGPGIVSIRPIRFRYSGVSEFSPAKSPMASWKPSLAPPRNRGL